MSRFIPVALIVSVFAVLISVGLPALNARAAPALVGLSQGCSGGVVNVGITWQGNDTGGKEQWVDLGDTDNGWQAGTFTGAGPLSPGVTTYTWTGLSPSSGHVVRIDQKQLDDSWKSSPTIPFSTISCVASQDAPASTSGSGSGSSSGSSSSSSASTATPTPTSTPSAPSPTPSPIPSPTPVPQVIQVIGFSDHTSNGGPPPDVVAPGGLLQSCGSPNVFAFVKYSNVRSRQEFFVSWVVGQSSLPRANLIISPGNGTAIVDFPLQDSTKTTYTLQLNLDKDKPPVAEGSFTIQC